MTAKKTRWRYPVVQILTGPNDWNRLGKVNTPSTVETSDWTELLYSWKWLVTFLGRVRCDSTSLLLQQWCHRKLYFSLFIYKLYYLDRLGYIKRSYDLTYAINAIIWLCTKKKNIFFLGVHIVGLEYFIVVNITTAFDVLVIVSLFWFLITFLPMQLEKSCFQTQSSVYLFISS